MSSIALAEYLKHTGALRSQSVYQAFISVDRKKFVPSESYQDVYTDFALEIGYGQTISQPYTVALMLEFLDVHPGMKVLDLGSGSGWTTALLAHMVGPAGHVIGVERVPELVTIGRENLAKYKLPWAQIIQAEPGVYGLPSKAPYDRILVSAEAEEVPNELIDQLAIDGVLVMPVNGPVIKVRKGKDGRLSQERIRDYLFVFVPLIKQ